MPRSLFIAEHWKDLNKHRTVLRRWGDVAVIGILNGAGTPGIEFEGRVCVVADSVPGGSDASARITRRLREWSNRAVFGGRTIKIALAHGRLTLWWFADSWLVQNAYFTPDLGTIADTGEIIAGWVVRYYPEAVISLTASPWINRILTGVCAEASVPCTILSRRRELAGVSTVQRALLAWLKVLRIPAICLAYKIQDLCGRLSRNRWPDRPRILIFSGDQWQRVFDPVTQTTTEGDLHFSGILSALRSRCSFAFLTYVATKRIVLKRVQAKLAQRAQGWPVSYLSFFGYVTWRVLRTSWRTFLQLRTVWPQLAAPAGWESFGPRWIAQELERRFRFYRSVILLEHLLAIEAAREALEREHPQLLLVVGESRAEAKALLMAARERKVPSLALQHGRFADHYYMLTQQDRSDDLIQGFPLPDRFALYGDYYKGYLQEKANIPREVLRVTGAPRWDFVAYPQALPARSLMATRLGLRDDLPIILLGTNELPEMPLVTRMVGSAMGHLPNGQLIVKLHPSERRSWSYRIVLQKAGIRRAVFVQAGDLYELLACCNVVVTPVSTLVIDAAIMDRPIILADPFRLHRAALFGNHQAIRVAETAADLERHLHDVLAPDSLADVWRAQRADLAQRHAYQLDGLAYRRVVRLIDELIAHSRSGNGSHQ